MASIRSASTCAIHRIGLPTTRTSRRLAITAPPRISSTLRRRRWAAERRARVPERPSTSSDRAAAKRKSGTACRDRPGRLPFERGDGREPVSEPRREVKSAMSPRRLSERERRTGGTRTAAHSTARINRTGIAKSLRHFACTSTLVMHEGRRVEPSPVTTAWCPGKARDRGPSGSTRGICACQTGRNRDDFQANCLRGPARRRRQGCAGRCRSGRRSSPTGRGHRSSSCGRSTCTCRRS
jgi:hypothetical protein